MQRAALPTRSAAGAVGAAPGGCARVAGGSRPAARREVGRGCAEGARSAGRGERGLRGVASLVGGRAARGAWVRAAAAAGEGASSAPSAPAPPPSSAPGGDVILEDLPLTPASIEAVLTEVRPYLVADGGDVELGDIVGSTVYLRLRGACGSCPSSSTTMALGLKRRLMEAIPAIEDVKELLEHDPTSLELSEESVEGVLAEIRPYLVGAGGGALACEGIDDANIVTVRIDGPAARVTTVRVAIAQKLRERIPKVAAVRIVP